MSGKRKKRPRAHVRSDLVTLCRAFVGPAFVIGGWQLIPLSYVVGVLIVYAGFALCLAECIWEPALLARPYQLQIALIGVVFALGAAFSISVVLVLAPLTFDSYAMRKATHADGTDVEGIHWDSRFTELRVAVTNPTDDDYRNLDVVIQPDKWIHKAVVVNRLSVCDLTSVGGNVVEASLPNKTGMTTFRATRIGDSFDFHDSMGNTYTTLASDGVTCPPFLVQG